MSRKPRSTAPTVTLFPFLAVLLCLMGSLVFLLMALSARVGVEPIEVVKPEPLPPRPPAEPVVRSVDPLPPKKSQDEVDAPHLVARASILNELEAIRSTIDARNTALADADDAERRKSAALAAAVGRLDRARASLKAAEADAADLDAKLRTLAANVTELEEEKSERAATVVARPTKFRLIPVDRFTGTQRHPIVVECLPNGFRFATEGVTVDADDFTGRRYTDNPLSNVLDALAIHYGKEGKQPYVLLLARPGAELSYGLARGLLVSSGRKWGYELIPDGMELDWPPVDETAKQVALAAIGPAGLGGQQLAGRPLSATGDIFGMLHNEKLRSMAMTGRQADSPAGPQFRPSTGQSPADAFLPTNRRPSGGGFDQIARGDFRRPKRTTEIAVRPASRRRQIDLTPPDKPVKMQLGSLSNPASASNSSSNEKSPTTDELNRFAKRNTAKRRDDGPHWMTQKPDSRGGTAKGQDEGQEPRDTQGGSASRPDGTGPADEHAMTKAAKSSPQPVQPSRNAEECLACRQKPWDKGLRPNLIGWEREIAVRVNADSLRAGDYDLPNAGTFPSKTLARLLTELTLVKLDEWGEPRPGMYWSPVIVLEGGGPMAVRIEQAAQIADITVRRRATR